MSASKSRSQRPDAAVQGFAEAPQAAFSCEGAAPAAKAGFGLANRVRLTLGPGGRVVIPAALREAMGVGEGDAILAFVEEGELHMVSPKVGAQRARALVRKWVPEGVSLADELIAQRRSEAESRD